MTASPVELIARAAIFSGDRALLCRSVANPTHTTPNATPNTFLPGGHVEAGETLAAALARELREELADVGDVGVGAHLGVVEHAWDDGGRMRCELNHVFAVSLDFNRGVVDEENPRAREPSIAFSWEPIAELHTLLPWPMQPLLRLAHAGAGDVFSFESTRAEPRATVVRALVPEDTERLRRARLFALAEMPSAFGSTLAREKDRPRASWVQWATPVPERISLVADDGDRICGMATGKDGELLGMWVHPSHRGTDVAARLVEGVATWTRGNGARSLALWVTEGNARAIAFYQRVGFVLTNDTQPLPWAPAVRELRMTLPLA